MDDTTELLQSELARHPETGELFMIDRAADGSLLAFAGPLDRAQVWAGHAPRALISLGADQDWFVRHAEPAPDEELDEDDEELEEEDTLSEDVIRAVLAWAEAIPWQPVARYRRVDEFSYAPADGSAQPREPRFVRTVYMLESVAAAAPELPGTPPAPPAAPDAPPTAPLWSGPGPVSLG